MAIHDDQLFTNNVESTQTRAFASGELVACPSCSRANPPTRANCLYCGALLGGSVEVETSAAMGTVPREEVEDVVHVVAVPGQCDGFEVNAELAHSLNLGTSELNSLLNSRVAPLYATTSANQVQAISENLRAAGIEPLTMSDEQLRVATPPKQIAALAMENDGLTASGRRRGEKVSVFWDDVVLIVLGRLYFTTTEVEQKRDKSKQVLDERQLTSDEAVLDIYPGADEIGWRIRAGTFDFSCLGAEKKLIAFENFRVLVDVLQRSATHAVCDDGYVQMRVPLNKVWPLQTRATASERRRTLTRDVDATATISDNELQFTRYSRLLRFLAPQLQNNAQRS